MIVQNKINLIKIKCKNLKVQITFMKIFKYKIPKNSFIKLTKIYLIIKECVIMIISL